MRTRRSIRRPLATDSPKVVAAVQAVRDAAPENGFLARAHLLGALHSANPGSNHDDVEATALALIRPAAAPSA